MCDFEKAENFVEKNQLDLTLVVLEFVLTIWTYYVYVWLICCKTLQDRVEVAILLSVYHLLFVLNLWCYLRALLTPRIPVPPEFQIDQNTWNQLELDSSLQQQTKIHLGIKTTTYSQRTLNYCHVCKNLKPDRCHHCSRCKACVLRMDHHCPWLNRCVGFHNQKFFFLLIHYTFVYSVFLVITCTGALPRIYRNDWVGDLLDVENQDWKLRNSSAVQLIEILKSTSIPEMSEANLTTNISSSKTVADSAPSSSSLLTAVAGSARELVSAVAGAEFSAVFVQTVVLVVVYSVVLFSLFPLLALHNELLSGNITTLEINRPLSLHGGKASSKIFDLGSRTANHKEIMGPQIWLWPFPVFTSQGDGVHFPVRGEIVKGRTL
ncbi:hypothetical protein EGW08_019091 [Elysia chlorotica]|uniref:Palmitoyltransferase n=1 Tax=Elysia chlorotica TaxID=188477 RepID=A0A3S1B237_ELYCH|nr:hypothetical protein EGW08_019091 [Elysia chlorotica]